MLTCPLTKAKVNAFFPMYAKGGTSLGNAILFQRQLSTESIKEQISWELHNFISNKIYTIALQFIDDKVDNLKLTY